MTILLEETFKIDKPVRPIPKRDSGEAETERMRQWLADRIERARKEPITEIVTLTPVLARLLLENNPGNRPLSETQMERLGRDISGGLWEFNGESIIVAKGGELNNGQHRCLSVINTGKPIKVVMVFGTERASRMTIDTGNNRTIAQFLGMNGHHDTNALGTCASYYWMYKEKGRISRNTTDRPTKQQALHIVSHYSDMPESVVFASRKGVNVVSSRGIIAFAHYVLGHLVGNPPAEEFLAKLIDGNELRKGDPILNCRNRLLDLKKTFDINTKIECIFRAWNQHRTGERNIKLVLLGRLPTLEK